MRKSIYTGKTGIDEAGYFLKIPDKQTAKQNNTKKHYFCGKITTMGANSSYKAMCDIVEHAKDGTIFIPDDFTTCGTDYM